MFIKIMHLGRLAENQTKIPIYFNLVFGSKFLAIWQKFYTNYGKKRKVVLELRLHNKYLIFDNIFRLFSTCQIQQLWSLKLDIVMHHENGFITCDYLSGKNMPKVQPIYVLPTRNISISSNLYPFSTNLKTDRI